ncbi:ADP-ribosylglycohydrolase family protein, partial [Streptomyces sp. ms191]
DTALLAFRQASSARGGAGAWPKEWEERIEYRSELLTLGALWDV